MEVCTQHDNVNTKFPTPKSNCLMKTGTADNSESDLSHLNYTVAGSDSHTEKRKSDDLEHTMKATLCFLKWISFL